eukprot:TRINITY_DN47483_c0_g1_i1.p1 TRINITY_DN47483_c0_g1~~TRINITY_DN47483_c0_g1_i1.p1  ORF type:complete len:485 (+),score=212.44 TRINITY_DN47483_c0_g1_i1:46-1455(+)
MAGYVPGSPTALSELRAQIRDLRTKLNMDGSPSPARGSALPGVDPVLPGSPRSLQSPRRMPVVSSAASGATASPRADAAGSPRPHLVGSPRPADAPAAASREETALRIAASPPSLATDQLRVAEQRAAAAERRADAAAVELAETAARLQRAELQLAASAERQRQVEQQLAASAERQRHAEEQLAAAADHQQAELRAAQEEAAQEWRDARAICAAANAAAAVAEGAALRSPAAAPPCADAAEAEALRAQLSEVWAKLRESRAEADALRQKSPSGDTVASLKAQVEELQRSRDEIREPASAPPEDELAVRQQLEAERALRLTAEENAWRRTSERDAARAQAAAAEGAAARMRAAQRQLLEQAEGMRVREADLARRAAALERVAAASPPKMPAGDCDKLRKALRAAEAERDETERRAAALRTAAERRVATVERKLGEQLGENAALRRQLAAVLAAPSHGSPAQRHPSRARMM